MFGLVDSEKLNRLGTRPDLRHLLLQQQQPPPLPVRDEDGPAVVYRDVTRAPGDELGVARVLAGHLTVIITMIIILSLDHDGNVTDRPRDPG